MSTMHDIPCKHCGGAISLNEDWDRTSDGVREGDWITRSCVICGGLITLYKLWVDPPKAHSECMDGRWHDQPCTMCFGPMAIPVEIEIEPKFHPRCVPENWYERACDVCRKPMRIHVDWEEAPTVHRNCESLQWYEKSCKYCNAELKVHISWEKAPDAHPECEPILECEIEPVVEIELSPVPEIAVLLEESHSSNGFGDANGHYHSNGHELDTNGNGHVDALPQPETILEMSDLAPQIESFGVIAENAVELDDEILDIERFMPEIEGSFTVGESLDTDEVTADNGSIEFREEDIPLSEEYFDETPIIDTLPVEDEFATEQVEHSETVADELIQTSEDRSEQHTSHDSPEESLPDDDDYEMPGTQSAAYYCGQCGTRSVAIEEMHLVSYRSLKDPGELLCQKCSHDAQLVDGAVAALRKGFSFPLEVAVEQRERSVTENITVVTNAETGEVVAEIKLCDDGIFRVERTALTYNPSSGERFSRTVFGHKGFFSSLRTTETFDRTGKLVQHMRLGKEIALAADDEPGEHASRITKNRFFVRGR